MDVRSFEPSARSSFIYSLVDGKLYIWGGLNKDVLLEKTSLEEFAAQVYSFDPYQEVWTSITPTGSPPAGIYHGSCTSEDNHLFTYGGMDGAYEWDGSLNSLNIESLTWSKLANTGPMKKQNCGMIAYDNQLLLFGGYGILSETMQPGSAFEQDWRIAADQGGWTNELHIFDHNQGKVAIVIW